MHFQWFRMEHHRLHVVEEWPESPQKHAALAGIRSKLASLARNLPPDFDHSHCEICLSRAEKSRLVALPVPCDVAESSSNGLAA